MGLIIFKNVGILATKISYPLSPFSDPFQTGLIFTHPLTRFLDPLSQRLCLLCVQSDYLFEKNVEPRENA